MIDESTNVRVNKRTNMRESGGKMWQGCVQAK